MRRSLKRCGRRPAPPSARPWFTARLGRVVFALRRAGHPESHLLRLGVSNATFRHLRYLELPPWEEVAVAARKLCRDSCELQALQKLWAQGEQEQQLLTGFGPHLKELTNGWASVAANWRICSASAVKSRRIFKHIEEDGLYSAVAYPAGLVAVLTTDSAERTRLLDLWQQRRVDFHRRRRPETRTELRLVRRTVWVQPGRHGTAAGLHQPGVSEGRARRQSAAGHRASASCGRCTRRVSGAWTPCCSSDARRRCAGRCGDAALGRGLITSLADREGGLLPLARLLKGAGLRGLWIGRLRAMVQCCELPAWPVLEQLALVCGVEDLSDLRQDWSTRYRAQLQERYTSPLAVELRGLIAEKANTLRDLSPKLGFNYSVLVREFQRIDHDEPLRWFHIERLLRVLQVRPDGERWKEIRALWSTVCDRNKPAPAPRGEKLG